jgi:uncharacterized membrane protein YidH (DUF202 family)
MINSMNPIKNLMIKFMMNQRSIRINFIFINLMYEIMMIISIIMMLIITIILILFIIQIPNMRYFITHLIFLSF